MSDFLLCYVLFLGDLVLGMWQGIVGVGGRGGGGVRNKGRRWVLLSRGPGKY